MNTISKILDICRKHSLAFLLTETHDIIIGDWTDVHDSYYEVGIIFKLYKDGSYFINRDRIRFIKDQKDLHAHKDIYNLILNGIKEIKFLFKREGYKEAEDE